jgi:septal ring factor EnvC (AmiA/AmiB activator)
MNRPAAGGRNRPGPPPGAGATPASLPSPGTAKALLLVLLLVVASQVPPAAFAATGGGKAATLRKEKARLEEVRRKAEAAVAELQATLSKESKAKRRVEELKGRIAAQKERVARVDRRIRELSGRLDEAERDVARLEEARRASVTGLARAAASAFEAERERDATFPPEAERERARHLAAIAVSAGRDRLGRIEEDRGKKAEELSGIRDTLHASERSAERERQATDALASRREEEAKRLADLARQRRGKEREVAALRQRIARMESLLARIEREAAEAERKRGSRPRPGRKEAPRRFASVEGGFRPPVEGGVVTVPFGLRTDPLFDVQVESRGVEIEARGGSAVRAVAKGEVAFLGSVDGFGRVLILRHGNGLYSVYGKAASFSVRQGASVAAGQEVGRLASGEGGKGVLYLELRAGGTAVDPRSVVPLSR